MLKLRVKNGGMMMIDDKNANYLPLMPSTQFTAVILHVHVFILGNSSLKVVRIYVLSF